MVYSELKAKIRGLIQEPTSDFYTEVNAWINDASFEATKDVGFPWKEKTQAVTKDQADYDLPADFIRLEPMLPSYFNRERIYKKSLSQLIEIDPNYRSATSGTPDTFYIYLPSKISLYVPPTSDKSGDSTAGSTGTTLKDSLASFVSSMVGDAIVSGVYSGTITVVTDANTLTAQLYEVDGVTPHDWSVGMEYITMNNFIYPYTYKETAMAADGSTTLIATRYPDLIIFKVAALCTMKASDGGTNCERKIARWENKYNQKVAEVRSEIAVLLHGNHETTLVG